ncbi:MAG TPA: hypothetical protein VLA34_10725, partial [Candidatus Krumholzibacterium sp.]|nr:hypothetical protein [Candidatus Krumholzibacterium sp.]
ERRGGGSRYMQSVQNALKVQPPFITVNSFNNWLEGTQIEPAAPMAAGGYKYSDYGAQNEFLYLKLSSQWVQGFSR